MLSDSGNNLMATEDTDYQEKNIEIGVSLDFGNEN
jgi:hypothetical protein